MTNSERMAIGGVLGMYGASETGQRDRDEDFIACGFFDDVKVGVLCDGMGGGAKGDVASKTVAMGFVKGVEALVRSGQGIRKSDDSRQRAYLKIIEKCHDVVCKISGGPGMSGTTITALVIFYEDGGPKFADIVHMGDSRCYGISDSGAELLTDDHSVSGDMHRSGFIELHNIAKSSGSSTLTRNIGDESVSEPDISTIQLSEISQFLLCCDGVWGPLHDKGGLWLPESPVCSEDSVNSMVSKAIEMGSTDNCSVLAIDVMS